MGIGISAFQPFLLPLLQGEIGLPGPPGHDGDKVNSIVYSKDSASGSHPGSVGRRAQEQAQPGEVRRARKRGPSRTLTESAWGSLYQLPSSEPSL